MMQLPSQSPPLPPGHPLCGVRYVPMWQTDLVAPGVAHLRHPAGSDQQPKNEQ